MRVPGVQGKNKDRVKNEQGWPSPAERRMVEADLRSDVWVGGWPTRLLDRESILHGLRVHRHSKQNRNNQCTINSLSNDPVRNQRVSRKSVKFSTTQTLEMFNLKQPKPPPQVAPMVRVPMNHNLLIEHLARFVTI